MAGFHHMMFNYNAIIGPYGQVEYLSEGTYSFIVPDEVTTISAVLVGPGGCAFMGANGGNHGGGGGGGLRYINDLPVTPGETLTIVVGAPGVQTSTSVMIPSTNTLLKRDTSILLEAQAGFTGGRSGVSSTAVSGGNGGGGTAFGIGPFGGTVGGGNGGAGGSTKSYKGSGGGGAGGYTGSGGIGGSYTTKDNFPAPTNGSGGAGAGGNSTGGPSGQGGGGVGLLGEGTSGVIYGGGGSGGSNNNSRIGGNYGGGGGGRGYGYSSGTIPGGGGNGAARIIWGTSRAFPSTQTGNL